MLLDLTPEGLERFEDLPHPPIDVVPSPPIHGW